MTFTFHLVKEGLINENLSLSPVTYHSLFADSILYFINNAVLAYPLSLKRQVQ